MPALGPPTADLCRVGSWFNQPYRELALRRNIDLRAGYALRGQACLIAVLLMAIGVVRFWPLPDDDEPRFNFRLPGQETIEIEQILPTKQIRKKPPPPPPSLEVVVADDEIIEDYELDLPEELIVFTEGTGDESDVNDGAPASGLPDLIEPRPVRIVEPQYTREAQRRKIRAEVVVEVLVDERGQVSTARVIERFLLDKDEKREVVGELGFGLEESAIDAARRCLFRPARYGGRPVSGSKTLRFSFGV